MVALAQLLFEAFELHFEGKKLLHHGIALLVVAVVVASTPIAIAIRRGVVQCGVW